MPSDKDMTTTVSSGVYPYIKIVIAAVMCHKGSYISFIINKLFLICETNKFIINKTMEVKGYPLYLQNYPSTLLPNKKANDFFHP